MSMLYPALNICFMEAVLNRTSIECIGNRAFGLDGNDGRYISKIFPTIGYHSFETPELENVIRENV